MEQVVPLLRMSQRELTRLEVIQRVKRKTLKQRQAAELLGLSVRQVNVSAKHISERELRR
jgi:predicted XRE-type DNA-binding protein